MKNIRKISTYTKTIECKVEWKFYELYADEGISGISHKNRIEFNKMIDDALSGKFNLIITKSISRFADGRYCVPLKQFLGYDKGPNDKLVVNESQAITVRLIFKLFLEGKTPVSLAKYLENLGILTPPSGMKKWSQTTVNSFLTNEKYKGDALLQKKFTVDFMTKKRKRNEGELPQYYVTDGHEPIIPRATFDLVQEIVGQRRENYAKMYSCKHPLTAKIQCGDCGSYFGLKSSHSGKYQRYDWYCNSRTKNGFTCQSPRVREDYMEQICKSVFAELLSSRGKMLDYFFELVNKNLSYDLCDDKTTDRLLQIKKYIIEDLFVNVNKLEVTDVVLSVTIKKILATVDRHLVFEFMDGENIDVTFNVNNFK